MLLKQLPSIVCAIAATWFAAGVAAQDDDNIKSIPLRTHSLSSPYLDTDLQSRWWDYGGDTLIRADKYVRLTSDRPSQSGWIFSRVPLTATNWQIELEFSINGKGSLFGDGFAMWVTKNRAQQGDVFGMQDKFEGLGIFFDTYKNNRPGVVFPYVMGMLGDGQTTYDKANDGKANELAGCSVRGVRNANFPTKARVTYFAEKSLKVEMMYKKEDEWTNCFEVSNIKLPSVSYLGFSGETGELSDNHDIIKVETKNLYSPSKPSSNTPQKEFSKNKNKGSSRNQSRKQGGGWGWFFLKFVFFGLALVGAYVGFTVYRARSRDRF
ncbi:putative lectin family integral membrane protein [Delphinella strobiligena]|nr:putative lectin family integral membrane protein [Delphinella strobiligena]